MIYGGFYHKQPNIKRWKLILCYRNYKGPFHILQQPLVVVAYVKVATQNQNVTSLIVAFRRCKLGDLCLSLFLDHSLGATCLTTDEVLETDMSRVSTQTPVLSFGGMGLGYPPIAP